VGKELKPRIRKRLLETPGKALREEGIIFSPQQQDRMLKARETTSCFQGVALGDRLQEAAHVTTRPWKMKQRMEESIEFIQLWTTMGKGCHKQTLSGTSAKHPGQDIGEPYPKDPRPIMERADQGREKVLKGIAVGEDETGNPLGMVCNHQLANGPPGIIADQGHLVEIKCFQKISHEVSHPKGAQIRIWLQGVRMSPQRKVWSNAAKV